METNEMFPILQSGLSPSKYERVLMTRLRDINTPQRIFRLTANQLADLLVQRTVECLQTESISINTPVAAYQGEALNRRLEFVSIMRSGDALLETFCKHFPDAIVNKILIQRDEETAKPIFKYMRLSPTLANDCTLVITEPMIATGGTLELVIRLLKERGVSEENIIIASICAAPEGLQILANKFPGIKVAVIEVDEKLNEKKYIHPGLGDFGDRYFGT